MNLEAVERHQNEAIRRFDQFQAAAESDHTIVVVGNQGLVLRSRDRGAHWQRTKLPNWPDLISVTACPNGLLAALAVEGQVWTSRDNGKDWVSHPLDTEEAPQDVTCDPRNRLWVVGSFSSIFNSTDGGENWDLDSLDDDLILTNIQFLDSDNAFITGEFGTVLKSRNGGETWEPMPSIENEFYPQDMLFTDPDTGWVAGLGGEVLHTINGAESWVVQESNTIAPLFGIASAGDEFFAVGGEGVVLRLTGERWARVDHGKPIYLYLRAALGLGSDTLLVAGGAGALYLLPVVDLPGAGNN